MVSCDAPALPLSTANVRYTVPPDITCVGPLTFLLFLGGTDFWRRKPAGSKLCGFECVRLMFPGVADATDGLTQADGEIDHCLQSLRIDGGEAIAVG